MNFSNNQNVKNATPYVDKTTAIYKAVFFFFNMLHVISKNIYN